MREDEQKHKLKFRDFIPVIGIVNYHERNNNPTIDNHPNISDAQYNQIMLNSTILIIYTTAIFGVALSGLDKLLLER